MGISPQNEHFEILKRTERDINHLSVMEALFIRETNPKLNTKDEFRGRLLRIEV